MAGQLHTTFMNLLMQAVTVGDINSDGELEVVFGTSSGAIYALAGRTGRDVGPFPFRTRGNIMAPVMLAPLAPRLGPRSAALHAVVQSYDGHLYAVDGITGVLNRLLHHVMCLLPGSAMSILLLCLTTQSSFFYIF